MKNKNVNLNHVNHNITIDECGETYCKDCKVILKDGKEIYKYKSFNKDKKRELLYGFKFSPYMIDIYNETIWDSSEVFEKYKECKIDVDVTTSYLNKDINVKLIEFEGNFKDLNLENLFVKKDIKILNNIHFTFNQDDNFELTGIDGSLSLDNILKGQIFMYLHLVVEEIETTIKLEALTAMLNTDKNFYIEILEQNNTMFTKDGIDVEKCCSANMKLDWGNIHIIEGIDYKSYIVDMEVKDKNNNTYKSVTFQEDGILLFRKKEYNNLNYNAYSKALQINNADELETNFKKDEIDIILEYMQELCIHVFKV